MSSNIISIMNDFFTDDSFNSTVRPFVSRSISMAPALNVKEFYDRYEIYLKAPGLEPENFKVEINDKIVNISYEENTDNAQTTEQTDEGSYIRYEYATHETFMRSMMLAKTVDKSTIEAEYEKGILMVKINKVPEVQPHRVEVRVKGK